jgi:hypothetical protein
MSTPPEYVSLFVIDGGIGLPGPLSPSYQTPIVGPLTFTLPFSRAIRQGFNCKNGTVAFVSNVAAELGDVIGLYDTGGFAGPPPGFCATVTDPNGYWFQDPQGQGLVLAPTYSIQQAGASITWTLTHDTLSGITYWAATG